MLAYAAHRRRIAQRHSAPHLMLAIFAVMQYVLIVTLGGSVGHVVLGMRVRPLTGGYVSLWRPALRTVLLCLVVPAVVWNADQRGLHDVFSGTVLVRTS